MAIKLTIEHLKKHPEKLARFTKVNIWSGQWRAWWREGAHGYSDHYEAAGVFTPAEAFAQTRHAGPEKKIVIYEVRKA